MNRFVIMASVLLICAVCMTAPVAGQSLVISLQASTGAVDSDIQHFGVYNDALMLVDHYDLPQPPPPPSGHLCLAFAMVGYLGPLPNLWRDEFRPTLEMDDETEDWTLIIDTDQVGQTARLSFAALVGWDLPLAVVVSPAEGRPKRDSLPAEIDVLLTSEFMELIVTLIWDDPTASENAVWGEVKALYGPE